MVCHRQPLFHHALHSRKASRSSGPRHADQYVKVNLFLRTIKTFSDVPVNNNDIGCFALTESNAGVLSGLVVDIKFEELESGDYILNSGDCTKRWISQGMFATKSLVFASNVNNHRDCRIFMIEMPCEGVTRTRMNGGD